MLCFWFVESHCHRHFYDFLYTLRDYQACHRCNDRLHCESPKHAMTSGLLLQPGRCVTMGPADPLMRAARVWLTSAKSKSYFHVSARRFFQQVLVALSLPSLLLSVDHILASSGRNTRRATAITNRRVRVFLDTFSYASGVFNFFPMPWPSLFIASGLNAVCRNSVFMVTESANVRGNEIFLQISVALSGRRDLRFFCKRGTEPVRLKPKFLLESTLKRQLS